MIKKQQSKKFKAVFKKPKLNMQKKKKPFTIKYKRFRYRSYFKLKKFYRRNFLSIKQRQSKPMLRYFIRKAISKKKKKRHSGFIIILAKKKNIFVNLSSKSGKILYVTSLGKIKVKGKRRIANHLLKSLTKLLIQNIYKSSIRKFAFFWKGYLQRKKKRNILKNIGAVKAFKFQSFNIPNLRSHNGCRPPKIRRK